VKVRLKSGMKSRVFVSGGERTEKDKYGREFTFPVGEFRDLRPGEVVEMTAEELDPVRDKFDVVDPADAPREHEVEKPIDARLAKWAADVLTGSVADVRRTVEDVRSEADLEALSAAESTGKNRSGALRAIADRGAVLRSEAAGGARP
jgi:hypothetical protein